MNAHTVFQARMAVKYDICPDVPPGHVTIFPSRRRVCSEYWSFRAFNVHQTYTRKARRKRVAA